MRRGMYQPHQSNSRHAGTDSSPFRSCNKSRSAAGRGIRHGHSPCFTPYALRDDSGCRRHNKDDVHKDDVRRQPNQRVHAAPVAGVSRPSGTEGSDRRLLAQKSHPCCTPSTATIGTWEGTCSTPPHHNSTYGVCVCVYSLSTAQSA